MYTHIHRYVSHELRTPLSILLTGLELLEGIVKEGGSTEEIISTIEDLKQPCRTSVAILNDLLAYEKLDAGIMQLERVVQDPCAFFQSTLAPFGLLARSKSIQLIVDSELVAGEWHVDIDETKVNRSRSVIQSIVHMSNIELCTLGRTSVSEFIVECFQIHASKWHSSRACVY